MVGRGGGQGCAEKGKVKMLVQWGKMFSGARKAEECDAYGLDSSRCPKKLCVCVCCRPGSQKNGFHLHFEYFLACT